MGRAVSEKGPAACSTTRTSRSAAASPAGSSRRATEQGGLETARGLLEGDRFLGLSRGTRIREEVRALDLLGMLARRADHRRLDRVLELADVPRPLGRLGHAERVGRELERGKPV